MLQNTFNLRYLPPQDIKYKRNRLRFQDLDKGLLISRWSKFKKPYTRDKDRFIIYIIQDIEKRGVISLNLEGGPTQTWPLVIQDADRALDLYFPYNFKEKSLKSLESTTSYRALPPPNYLIEFAKAFKEKHPNALMAKGSIQTHYCAQPIPAVKQLRKIRLNFGTWQGHIYY